jgi:hypothetical protein
MCFDVCLYVCSFFLSLLREVSRMRDLDPSNIDQLVCIKVIHSPYIRFAEVLLMSSSYACMDIVRVQGMVIRCSPVMPDLKQAFFR